MARHFESRYAKAILDFMDDNDGRALFYTGEIHDRIKEVSQPAVSQGLNRLADAGFLLKVRHGMWQVSDVRGLQMIIDKERQNINPDAWQSVLVTEPGEYLTYLTQLMIGVQLLRLDPNNEMLKQVLKLKIIPSFKELVYGIPKAMQTNKYPRWSAEVFTKRDYLDIEKHRFLLQPFINVYGLELLGSKIEEWISEG